MSEPAQKRLRTGVGTSVATLETSPQDDFILTLTKIRCERLLPKTRTIVTSNREELVPVAFRKLVNTNVLSLPVLTKQGKFFAMVDAFDLVRFVTEEFSDVELMNYVDVEALFEKEKQFNNTTVGQIVKHPIRKNPPFHPLTKGFSLFCAWEALALGGYHRVPVIDDENNICDVITQSMLIDFLYQNVEKIKEMRDRELKDLKCMKNQAKVSTVNKNSRAITAFRQMIRQNIHGLAVIDDRGHLVDNISLRDLRGIHPDVNVFWRLWNTIAEFKGKERADYPDQTPKGVIYAFPTDTFESVIEKMARQHIHRVYVVVSKDDLTPTHVISQTDVLQEIIGKF
jgi:CBS-domain-containing membrane protein